MVAAGISLLSEVVLVLFLFYSTLCVSAVSCGLLGGIILFTGNKPFCHTVNENKSHWS